MRRWGHLLVQHAIKPLVSTVLVASLFFVPLPLTSGQARVEAAPPAQVPAGQLTRKTISGTVVAVDGSSITIETRHGNVRVTVTSETVVNAPPESNVGLDAIQVGDKAVAFSKRPPTSRPTEDGGDGGATATATTTATTTTTSTATTTATTTDSGDGSTNGTTTATTTDTTTATTTDSGGGSTNGTTTATTTDTPTATTTDSGGGSTNGTTTSSVTSPLRTQLLASLGGLCTKSATCS